MNKPARFKRMKGRTKVPAQYDTWYVD